MKALLIGHGYVGSFLRPMLEAAGHDVVTCDQNLQRLTRVPMAMRCRYQELAFGDFRDFDVILWFAGHSSVPMSLADPDGAVANNCLDLLKLARRKPSRTRLIYASTASVYSAELEAGSDLPPPELSEAETKLSPVNPYDCSKISFDALARCFAENVVGLRLGTVCGHSPQLRGELVFNAMNRMAIEERCVAVANSHAWRNILFLDDLAHYVLALLQHEGDLPPILNTGSFNLTIGELAETVAAFHGVPIQRRPDGKTYSFRMNCDLIKAQCGAPKTATLIDRCSQFKRAFAPTSLAMAS
ncbi:MAG TPA: NAD(P)-dependent oxidoreductase [Hyphomicrobium sp.]|nr:NAD(P)-dependent oxidoreductase [Hyphomicrobium sp.]